MTYSFSLHVHHFAIWTAARAVNRNFIGTKSVFAAIEKTGLPLKLEQLAHMPMLDSLLFDAFHKEAVNAIVQHLKNSLGSDAHKATYGRAAKVVAIYIKTRYVIPNPFSNLSKYAHPPIDFILLKNLSKNFKDLKLEGLKWTKLNEEEYFALVVKLRKYIKPEYFWELEEYWELR